MTTTTTLMDKQFNLIWDSTSNTKKKDFWACLSTAFSSSFSSIYIYLTSNNARKCTRSVNRKMDTPQKKRRFLVYFLNIWNCIRFVFVVCLYVSSLSRSSFSRLWCSIADDLICVCVWLKRNQYFDYNILCNVYVQKDLYVFAIFVSVHVYMCKYIDNAQSYRILSNIIVYMPKN